ncbi:MAG: cydA [Herbaspirillum sp.]|nr:cydA [Herbaspirillum sp.]
MELDIVSLSRLQFAATALYHFLFVPLTLGLSVLLAIMETVYVMTGRVIWRDMTKFWGILFGINFAMGVATGIVMEFQFGMNWSYYSHYVGDVFGAPLAIEGLTAFFLEAISAWYLLQGRHRELAKRSMTVAASFGLAAALSVVVLGDESGYLSGEHQKMKLAAIEGMWETQSAPADFTLIGFPNQEARETHYALRIPWLMGLIGTRSLDTEIPGINALVERAKVRIANGVKAYDALENIRAADAKAQILPALRAAFEDNGNDLGYALLLKRYVDDPRQATPEQISRAAWDTVPDVPPLFFLFRIMVGISVLLILLTAAFFVLSARHALDRYRWLLKVAVFAIPLPWIAIEAGWLVAEFGRQPWVIEGMLPTAVAVSDLGIKTLLISLAGFVLIYTVLFVIEMKLLFKYIRKGPTEEHFPGPGVHIVPIAAGGSSPLVSGSTP